MLPHTIAILVSVGATRHAHAGNGGIAQPPSPAPPPAPTLCVLSGDGLPLTDTSNPLADDKIEAHVAIIEEAFDEVKWSTFDETKILYGRNRVDMSQRGPTFDHCVISNAAAWSFLVLDDDGMRHEKVAACPGPSVDGQRTTVSGKDCYWCAALFTMACVACRPPFFAPVDSSQVSRLYISAGAHQGRCRVLCECGAARPVVTTAAASSRAHTGRGAGPGAL